MTAAQNNLPFGTQILLNLVGYVVDVVCVVQLRAEAINISCI